jgi:hypothetical protein
MKYLSLMTIDGARNLIIEVEHADREMWVVCKLQVHT